MHLEEGYLGCAGAGLLLQAAAQRLKLPQVELLAQLLRLVIRQQPPALALCAIRQTMCV